MVIFFLFQYLYYLLSWVWNTKFHFARQTFFSSNIRHHFSQLYHIINSFRFLKILMYTYYFIISGKNSINGVQFLKVATREFFRWAQCICWITETYLLASKFFKITVGWILKSSLIQNITCITDLLVRKSGATCIFLVLCYTLVYSSN